MGEKESGTIVFRNNFVFLVFFLIIFIIYSFLLTPLYDLFLYPSAISLPHPLPFFQIFSVNFVYLSRIILFNSPITLIFSLLYVFLSPSPLTHLYLYTPLSPPVLSFPHPSPLLTLSQPLMSASRHPSSLPSTFQHLLQSQHPLTRPLPYVLTGPVTYLFVKTSPSSIFPPHLIA